MSTPYDNLSPQAFWRRSVSSVPSFLLDPVANASFQIGPDDLVATAGSCFAQHLSHAIQSSGFKYLVTENGEGLSLDERQQRNYGVFTARFGNIYTVRQMRQLIERAYKRADYSVEPWRQKDGRLVDPFRPTVEPDGFASEDALLEDQKRHLNAVREMFSTLSVLVFTLGLTEAWEHIKSGSILPIAPGVSGGEWNPTNYNFVNFNTKEIRDDLDLFFSILKSVNPSARMLLTVSPVPLIATRSPTSVLCATTYSKSVLRVAAEEFTAMHKGVDYFPSFEIINNPVVGNRYFEPDFRNIRSEGIAHVMRVFFKHYVKNPKAPDHAAHLLLQGAAAEYSSGSFKLVCDEESIERRAVSSPSL